MSQTEGQISIFDLYEEDKADIDTYEALKNEISSRLEQIVTDKKLPPNGLLVRDNNGDTVISFSVCTNEPDFPCRPDQLGKIATLSSLFKVQMASTKKDAGKVWIDLSSNRYKENVPPSSAEIRELTKGEGMEGKRAAFDISDKNLVDYIVSLTHNTLKDYMSKAKTFACCSRFIECSDAKECVHENKLYSTACQYRRNLEAGRIFYGKNCNVED